VLNSWKLSDGTQFVWKVVGPLSNTSKKRLVGPRGTHEPLTRRGGCNGRNIADHQISKIVARLGHAFSMSRSLSACCLRLIVCTTWAYIQHQFNPQPELSRKARQPGNRSSPFAKATFFRTLSWNPGIQE
jgi:hypothetical protein